MFHIYIYIYIYTLSARTPETHTLYRVFLKYALTQHTDGAVLGLLSHDVVVLAFQDSIYENFSEYFKHNIAPSAK